MPLGVGQVARAALGRSRRGLFGGKRRLSGNKVSEDGDNKYAWVNTEQLTVQLLA